MSGGHRERLLRAALECLREKGYAATTARDIARAADVSLGAIGYHYGSKDALLHEAIGLGFREWTEHVATRVFAEPAASPADRLRLSLDATIESFTDQRPLLLAFVEALAPAARAPELRERLAQQYRESRAQFGVLLSAAMGERATDEEVDIEVLSSVLVAIFDGFVLQWLLEPEAVPRGDEVVEALRRAIRASDELITRVLDGDAG